MTENIAAKIAIKVSVVSRKEVLKYVSNQTPNKLPK